MRTVFHKAVASLASKGFFSWLDDKNYLRLVYWARMGKKLHIKTPVTFNEKLQWLKLYDHNPEYTKMVDKYEVKEYVSSVIGREYIIPTLGVWESFDQIDFKKLPDQFVLKCTHDSGGLVICKDKQKLDMGMAESKIRQSLQTNYYLHGREWPYKNVRPRIIAEQYMEDPASGELKDYKYFCFNGIPKIVLVCGGRFSDEGLTEDFFDMDWKHLDIKRPRHGNSSRAIPRPACHEMMMTLASGLSESLPFARIDFYEIDGRIYFGEITLFPANGLERFIPDKWDGILGGWMNLPLDSRTEAN